MWCMRKEKKNLFILPGYHQKVVNIQLFGHVQHSCNGFFLHNSGRPLHIAEGLLIQWWVTAKDNKKSPHNYCSDIASQRYCGLVLQPYIRLLLKIGRKKETPPISYSHNLQLAHFLAPIASPPSSLLPSPLHSPLSYIPNHRHAAQASKSIDNFRRAILTVIHHNTCNDNVISTSREWHFGLMHPALSPIPWLISRHLRGVAVNEQHSFTSSCL